MEHKESWKNFKNRYKVGQTVSGKIVHKAPFGVFIDIGEDFPCLLEIIEIENLNYDQYTSEKIFRLGEKVEGKVGDFTEENKQMRITQKN